MNDAPPIFRGGERASRMALGLGVFGAILLGLGAFVDRRQFFFSYLTAYAFAVSLAVGALIFLLTCNAMRAGWPVVVRRILEGILAAFPVLAVLFVPLAFGLEFLYPWVAPERLADAHERALVLHKSPYLNAPFFLARAAFFFAVWLVVAGLLRRWSHRQDEEPTIDVRSKIYRLSVGALPVVALAMSFAAFDWLMSLEPSWSSSMFPVYFFAGGFVGAIALVAVATYGAEGAGYLPNMSESHYYALGRLLLAFIVFWAYVAFFQFMLQWLANRPDEATFYLARAKGLWMADTIVLAIGHFVVPFALLLNFRLKRSGSFVAAMSTWILVFHYVDVHWLVAPNVRPDGFPLHWLDLAALLAVAGFSAAAALRGARGRRLLPIHDPRLAEALAYESP